MLESDRVSLATQIFNASCWVHNGSHVIDCDAFVAATKKFDPYCDPIALRASLEAMRSVGNQNVDLQAFHRWVHTIFGGVSSTVYTDGMNALCLAVTGAELQADNQQTDQLEKGSMVRTSEGLLAWVIEVDLPRGLCDLMVSDEGVRKQVYLSSLTSPDSSPGESLPPSPALSSQAPSPFTSAVHVTPYTLASQLAPSPSLTSPNPAWSKEQQSPTTPSGSVEMQRSLTPMELSGIKDEVKTQVTTEVTQQLKQEMAGDFNEARDDVAMLSQRLMALEGNTLAEDSAILATSNTEAIRELEGKLATISISAGKTDGDPQLGMKLDAEIRRNSELNRRIEMLETALHEQSENYRGQLSLGRQQSDDITTLQSKVNHLEQSCSRAETTAALSINEASCRKVVAHSIEEALSKGIMKMVGANHDVLQRVVPEIRALEAEAAGGASMRESYDQMVREMAGLRSKMQHMEAHVMTNSVAIGKNSKSNEQSLTNAKQIAANSDLLRHKIDTKNGDSFKQAYSQSSGLSAEIARLEREQVGLPAPPVLPSTLFTRLDSNQDGVIDRDEWGSRSKALEAQKAKAEVAAKLMEEERKMEARKKERDTMAARVTQGMEVISFERAVREAQCSPSPSLLAYSRPHTAAGASDRRSPQSIAELTASSANKTHSKVERLALARQVEEQLYEARERKRHEQQKTSTNDSDMALINSMLEMGKQSPPKFPLNPSSRGAKSHHHGSQNSEMFGLEESQAESNKHTHSGTHIL